MNKIASVRVTVVIPVFNEEGTIVTILERVNAITVPRVSFEVVVVDDGSRDRTRALLDARPDLYTTFIKHSTNRGKGGAVRSALGVATGEYILFQDADLEYDPAEYPRLLKPVLEFGADIVMGSRFLAPEFTRVHYFWHKMGNNFITTIFNATHNTTFTDIYSCYLVYRRSLVDPGKLTSDGWDQQAEILSKAVKKGLQFYEVPITYFGRTYDEGKKIKPRDVVSVISMIVRRALT